MNRATLLGRLGSDPELRRTRNDKAVLRLGVATNERVKRGDQWEDHTEWHNVIVWGARAESLSRILSKGSQVLIEGSIRRREYEKDGEKRFVTEIIANDIELGARSGSAQRSDGRDATDEAADSAGAEDDDIPF
jgi:single-strand DNA-binding protein